MSPIRLIHGASFDPDTTRLMGLAYEKATVGLDDISDREIVAKRVIEAARRGERELDKLVAYALDGLDGAAEAAG
jgi:hypothetical protein